MSSEIDFILDKRNITLFLSIENQSQYFGTRLMSSLFLIQSEIKDTNTIIIPVKGLDQDCLESNRLIEFCGQKYKCIFTKNDQYNNLAFILSTTKTSDSQLIEEFLYPFLSKCKQVVLCDIGVLKKRDFIQLFNNVSKYLETSNVAVCLASIIGYNTRGASDVETFNEQDIVTPDFYKIKDSKDSECIESNYFIFRQIQNTFKRADIAFLCSRTKNSIESKLNEIKTEACKTNIKMLCDVGLIDKGLNSRLVNDYDICTSFDFLRNIGLTDLLAFNIVVPQWKQTYNTLFNKIHNIKDIKERNKKISEFITQVKNDIDQMYKFINEI